MGHRNLPCTHQPTNSAYVGKSCIDYMYQTHIMKFRLLLASYVLDPLSQASCNSSLSGCMYTLGPGIPFAIFPRIVGPWNYQCQENVLSLHNLSGGGGEIEWEGKYGPTTGMGPPHTKHTETIRVGGHSRVPRVCRFVSM